MSFTGLAAGDPMMDAAERVSGRTRYVIDVAVPGMVHAAILRSPIAAGRIRRLDTAAAGKAPGVLRVITAADLLAAGVADDRFGTMDKDQPILAGERVAYVGDIVAAVVATSAEEARAATALIDLGIEPTPAVFDPVAALAPGAPPVRPGRRDNVIASWQATHGDVEAARATAVRHYAHAFRIPAAQQASLEPHVCVAFWEGDRLELWSTSQTPSRVAEELARVFGLEPGGARVHVPPLGGGYGGKNHAKLEPLVALLARLAGRPVRLVNPREDEFVTVTRHGAEIRVASGVGADGQFAYRTATLRWNGGAHALSSGAVVRAGGMAVLGPYRISAAAVDSVVAATNLPPAGSFRGLGVNQAAWAGEQQVDAVAEDLGIDPVEFRRKNLVRPGDRLWTGEAAGDVRWLECLERAVADLEADPEADRGPDPSSAPSRSHDRAIRRGRGVAVVMKQTITPSRSEAAVALRLDGIVEVRTSAVDMGQGVSTVLARIAGRRLGVGLDRIRPVLPDTAVTPFDVTSSASRLTASVGRAVELAVEDLLERLTEAASVALGVPPDRLTRRAGVTTADDGRSIDDTRVVATAGGGEIVGTAVYVNVVPTDPETGISATSSHWHQGAVAVEVAVDIETGIVTVERAHGAAWAGEVVSLSGARLQNEGNVIWGIGTALTECLAFDDDGGPSVRTLLDYRLPATTDLPLRMSTTALVAEPGTTGPASERHGLGESIVPAVAPAIGNAVAAATGGRVMELPIHPERVLAAMSRGDAS